jgi:glycosyltransferase involved in cell wall biosynthesis
VRGLLAGFSVFVMPSRVVEGFGLAALEAMAAGVPVVGTEPGARELISDGRDGFLVAAGAPAAMAGRIEGLLTDPALARRLARAGQAHAQQELTIERHVAAVETLYAQSVGERPALLSSDLRRIAALL